MLIASQMIAGVDEVGRGCLAGPVYAAAVVLRCDYSLPGLRDSKKLSPIQRERLRPQIERHALAWAIGIASVEEIDRLNILQATMLAMSRAVAALSLMPTLCLIDGNRAPLLAVPTRTVIGGDDLEPSIMAASVLAKQARDAQMTVLDTVHQRYGFAQHKGYGTPGHLEALRLLGPSPVHRQSFAPCRAALLDQTIAA